MKPVRRNFRVLALAVAAVGAAAFSPYPAAANNVAWSVAVGGPGFNVSAGQPAFGPAFRPGFRPIARPFVAPVAVRPFAFRPVVVARPAWVARPVFVAPPPVFFAPRPVLAPRFVVAWR
jgi:hypothetical protein